jgi:hypothetical protein
MRFGDANDVSVTSARRKVIRWWVFRETPAISKQFFTRHIRLRIYQADQKRDGKLDSL